MVRTLTSSAMRRSRLELCRLPSWSRWWSEPPRINSSTIAGEPLLMYVPRNEQIAGWRSCYQICISCTNMVSESCETSGSAY